MLTTLLYPTTVIISLLLLLTLTGHSTATSSSPLTKPPTDIDPTAILIDTPNSIAYIAPMRQDNLWHYFNETPCFPHRLDTVFASKPSDPIPCDKVAPDIVNLTSANAGHCVWKRKKDGVNVYVVPGVSWKVDLPDRSSWSDVCCGPICY